MVSNKRNIEAAVVLPTHAQSKLSQRNQYGFPVEASRIEVSLIPLVLLNDK